MLLLWLLGLITFWTTRVSAINQVYFVLILFLSGQIAPLTLFPRWLQIVANALRKGYRIVEVSSHERARAGGIPKSKVVQHGTRFLARILWEGYRGVNAPMRPLPEPLPLGEFLTPVEDWRERASAAGATWACLTPSWRRQLPARAHLRRLLMPCFSCVQMSPPSSPALRSW